MRPVRHVKIISSQLELLEEFKTQLDSVLDYTKNAIQKGNSWMEETNNETFFEMNQFLINETSECVRRCQDIDKDKHEECHQHSNLEEQDTRDTITKSADTLKTSKPLGFDFREEKEYNELFKNYQEMDKTITQSFRKLQKQFEKHKKETKETLCSEREEIWEELKKASNFMSCLQTENEDVNIQMVTLQEQIKEHEQKSETLMKQHKSTENSFF